MFSQHISVFQKCPQQHVTYQCNLQCLEHKLSRNRFYTRRSESKIGRSRTVRVLSLSTNSIKSAYKGRNRGFSICEMQWVRWNSAISRISNSQAYRTRAEWAQPSQGPNYTGRWSVPWRYWRRIHPFRLFLSKRKNSHFNTSTILPKIRRKARKDELVFVFG